jgi:cobalamin biosynthesis protein CobD/CbiB
MDHQVLIVVVTLLAVFAVGVIIEVFGERIWETVEAFIWTAAFVIMLLSTRSGRRFINQLSDMQSRNSHDLESTRQSDRSPA